MTLPPPDRPPAGWYADPERHGQRYWDGAEWTDDRRPAPRPRPEAFSIRSPITWVIIAVVVVVGVLSLTASWFPV